MYNDLFSIGPIEIHGYGVMIAIGVLAAFLVADYRSKRNGLDPDQIFFMAMWGLAGGFLGAKLLYYITIWREILNDPSRLLDNFGGGFVVYGGILGGILAAYLYARVKKMDFLRYLDLAVPSIALAQGFGRIGCFLAGCCYGLESSCPISITFQNSDFAPNGVSLLPTQLISSGLNFLNFIVLLLLAKRLKGKGQVAGLYLIFYSVGRFILEFFRGDLIRGSVGVLSTSQFISIFTFLLGVALFYMGIRKLKNEQKTESEEVK